MFGYAERMNTNLRFLVLGGIIILLIVGSGFALLFTLNYGIAHALETTAAARVINIPHGIGSGKIGELLQSEGFIRHRYFWYYYLWRRGVSNKLQAGEYELSASMTIPQIAEKLLGGAVVSHERRVTIPEGFTIEEIEKRLREKGYLVDMKKETTRLHLEEGYLFPDTYIFKDDAEAETIVTRMKENFDAKIESLKPSIDQSGHTLREIITMASLLEEEIPHPEDLPLAAGILWKRFNASMPLQVDATVLYAKGIRGGHGEERALLPRDLILDSPYNTYVRKGLPPGAICNPGLGAIRAALSPAQSDYWYYLSKPDGATVFSKTLEEHTKAKILYLR